MALVNLKIRPNQRTKWQKFCRKILRDRFYAGRRMKEFRDDVRFRKHHFNLLLEPYKPCGYEYVKDDAQKFTGVYIDNFGLAENWLSALTYNKAIDSLVDYGTVDNASQVIRIYEEECRNNPDKMVGDHVILLQRIWKHPGETGGFRWHKNGGYAGEANVCCEYFDDEPDEKLVMVYLYNVVQVCKPQEEDFG